MDLRKIASRIRYELPLLLLDPPFTIELLRRFEGRCRRELIAMLKMASIRMKYGVVRKNYIYSDLMGAIWWRGSGCRQASPGRCG
jgi:hypothetical protein